NAAARLQAAAGAGQTVVSESTWLLTQHAFRYEALGALPLKGKSQPLPAYRLEGAIAVSRPVRGLQTLGLAAPLVGREGECNALMDAFDAMLAGRTQLVSLVAEAGTGKTRLLSEFLDRL